MKSRFLAKVGLIATISTTLIYGFFSLRRFGARRPHESYIHTYIERKNYRKAEEFKISKNEQRDNDF